MINGYRQRKSDGCGGCGARGRLDVFQDYLNAVRAASMRAVWSQERLTIKVDKLATAGSEHRRGPAPAFPAASESAGTREESELAHTRAADIFACALVPSRPSSSVGRRTRPPSAMSAQGPLPQGPPLASGEAAVRSPDPRLKRDEADVWEQLRFAAAQVAVDSSGRPGGMGAGGAGRGAEEAGDASGLSVAKASQQSIQDLYHLRYATSRDGSGASGDGGGRPPAAALGHRETQAHARHVRTGWLLHAPGVVCPVSPAVDEFLVAAEALFEGDEIAMCLAQVERLVQGLASRRVQAALGRSRPTHVLISLCHLCNKLAVRCFLKRRPDDALVFFGTALVFAARVGSRLTGEDEAAAHDAQGREGAALSADAKAAAGADTVGGAGSESAAPAARASSLADQRRAETEGLKGLLKAWTLDQLAFCYTFVGERDAALAALSACSRACDEVLAASAVLEESAVGACRDCFVVGGSLAAAQEMRVVADSHRIQVELSGGRALEGLQAGLDLLQQMRARLAASAAAISGSASESGGRSTGGNRPEDEDLATLTLDLGGAASASKPLGQPISPTESELMAFLEAQLRQSGRPTAGSNDDGDAEDPSPSQGVVKQRILNVGEQDQWCDDDRSEASRAGSLPQLRARRRPFECLGSEQLSMGTAAAAAATAARIDGGADDVWMALWLAEVAANAVASLNAQPAKVVGEQRGGPAEDKKMTDALGMQPAVHSLEYVTAHVAHATAAAAAALGRVNDALPLLAYAQEIGGQARGPPRVASHGKAGGASKPAAKVRARLLSSAFTGISSHASATGAGGRKVYGRQGSGWDGTGGPTCLAKLVEECKAFFDFSLRNLQPAEVSPVFQDSLWSSKQSRPPSSADTIKSSATTRPSSAMSRPCSAAASAKAIAGTDSKAADRKRGARGLRVRPWSAAAGSLARLDPADRGPFAPLAASNPKVGGGGRVRPSSALGLSRHSFGSDGARSDGGALEPSTEQGAVGALTWKPMCDTLTELEASAQDMSASWEKAVGPDGPAPRPPALPSRSAFVPRALSGPRADGPPTRRPHSALSRSSGHNILGGNWSIGSTVRKSTFGTGHARTSAARSKLGGTAEGDACTLHAVRMEAVRAPRPRPASALR